jgi:hypothetical protein
VYVLLDQSADANGGGSLTGAKLKRTSRLRPHPLANTSLKNAAEENRGFKGSLQVFADAILNNTDLTLSRAGLNPEFRARYSIAWPR